MSYVILDILLLLLLLSLCDPVDFSAPGFPPCPSFSPVSWNLLKFMSVESVMSSNHLILCQLEVVTDHFILEALTVEI